MLGILTRSVLSASFAAALLIASFSASSAASFHRFAVTNRGYHTIVSVFISDPDGDWGPDQLGDSRVIRPGTRFTWSWNGNCYQDIMVVYSDGESDTTMSYDTCNYDLKSTY